MIAEIHKDPQYKKFKLMVERIQKTIDLESTIEECKTLHHSRISTKIKDSKGQFKPEMLIDANAIDLSNRARMTFIASELQLRLSKIDSAIDAIENYLVSTYADQYKLRTVDMRKKFVLRVIKNQHKYYQEGKACLEFIYALIKDIDQSGYHLRNMVDCIKILSEKKV